MSSVGISDMRNIGALGAAIRASGENIEIDLAAMSPNYLH